ncbi:type I restriction endonuclease EcoprrI subunit S [Shewanella chilikensis]|nr:type I restriction endonuclease EcoprrI subunit S [Shewanella chilikensis]
MSQLNYLEKLLDGVEVEWKALGEVCDFKNGFAFKSSLFKEAGLPIIRITNVDGKNISLDDVKYFDPSDYKENTASYEISKGDILIAMSGATTGKIGFYAHESPAYLNQRVGKFLPKPKILNNRYLYHYLLSKVEQIYVIAGGGAQPNLSSNALMAKIEIPIPCPNNPEKSLAIQAEIVRILDAFTAMTAELTAELNMRKKQYNYYRDKLLSFEEGEVEWKTLGEITRISSASRVHKNEWTTSGVPFFRTSDVISLFNGVKNSREDAFISNELYEKLSLKSGKLHKDDILVTGGGTIGIPYIVPTDEPLYFKDADLLCIKKSKSLNSKFLYHYLLTTKFRVYLENISHNSTIAHYTISQATKTPVPVPPLAEQARIVAILDKFDALTNSITEGLPREIELRQKQYEYYRDLLLSFPASPAGGPKSHSDEAA